MTAEQLEAARAERMRQNGHGAVTIEDVRTWIEETGLCVFLPRSSQAGQSILAAPTATPTFVEAVAGQRTPEPTLELITAAESLLVRLEAEGVAVRLNLAGQPGDQPDYVVAGWVLPYIYALRGDRDWRRSPQLTGSRQVSQLAVQAAKQLESANMTAAQIRDALGKEVTESAVLRALHELWKQLRIIPVVPEVGVPALWQPLRQRFQKAIAEGASTSQVTAISVLASIYLQAVIAASMEDVEMFLSPLTSRSKIREVVRGLAATRQVHTTSMGHAPMYYVAGTLPEFPAVPSYQISSTLPAYRSPSYMASYLDHAQEQERDYERTDSRVDLVAAVAEPEVAPVAEIPVSAPPVQSKPKIQTPASRPAASSQHAAKPQAKSSAPRPRTSRPAAPVHPRERSRSGHGSGHGLSESRSSANGDRRRAPAPRSGAGSSNPARPARNGAFSNGSHAAKPAHSNGNGHARSENGSHAGNGSNGSNGSHRAQGSNGNGAKFLHSGAGHNGSGHNGQASRPAKNGVSSNHHGNGAKSSNGAHVASRASGHTEKRTEKRADNRPASRNGSQSRPTTASRPGAGYKAAANGGSRNGNGAGAHKASSTARPKAASISGKRSPEPASRKPTASAAKRYSFSGQAKQAPKPVAKHASTPASGRTVKNVTHAASSTKSKSGAKSGSHSAHPAGSKRRG